MTAWQCGEGTTEEASGESGFKSASEKKWIETLTDAHAVCITSLMNTTTNTGAASGDYRIEENGAFYVIDTLSGESVSPPMRTRESAFDLKAKIEALPASERARLRAGKRPAPGCDWLIPGAR